MDIFRAESRIVLQVETFHKTYFVQFDFEN